MLAFDNQDFPTLNFDDSSEEEIRVAQQPSINAKKRPHAQKVEKSKPIIEISQLNPKQRELYESLDRFFTEQMLTDIIIPIQSQQKSICLRTLEHLVTSYSRPDSHNVEYLRSPSDRFPWKLHRSYQDLLKYDNKKKFDPFRRGDRIRFKKGNTELITTLAQLNFFRWSIQNKVIDWALLHADEIKADMMRLDALHKLPAEKRRKRKRCITLSTTSPRILNVQIQVRLLNNGSSQ